MKFKIVVVSLALAAYIALGVYGWQGYQARVKAQDKPKEETTLGTNGIGFSDRQLDLSSIQLAVVSQATTFQIMGKNGQPLVSINLQDSGKITYGKDYAPDLAAKAFWAAIGSQYPCRGVEKPEQKP